MKTIPPEAVIRNIVRNLDDIVRLETVFRRGAVHAGGPHYRLRGTLGPISIGEDECIVFGRLIKELRPVNCFIIGNGFGLSSVFISKMMEMHGGKSVITLDAKCEGDGDLCFEVAARLRDSLQCRILTNRYGWSPQDIDRAADAEAYDLIFIDGLHRHPQASMDFQGVRHLAHRDTIICWHDYWMLGIGQSVEEAQRVGYHCLKVNTSCEMVFGTQSEAVHRRIDSLYDNTEEPHKRLRPAAFLKACNALLVGAVRRLVAGRRGARVRR